MNGFYAKKSWSVSPTQQQCFQVKCEGWFVFQCLSSSQTRIEGQEGQSKSEGMREWAWMARSLSHWGIKAAGMSVREQKSAQRARDSEWPFNQPLGSEIWVRHTRRSSASFICFQSSLLSSSGCGRVGILIRDREGGSSEPGLVWVNEKTKHSQRGLFTQIAFCVVWRRTMCFLKVELL